MVTTGTTLNAIVPIMVTDGSRLDRGGRSLAGPPPAIWLAEIPPSIRGYLRPGRSEVRSLDFVMLRRAVKQK